MADTPIISVPPAPVAPCAPPPWKCGKLRGTRQSILDQLAASGLADEEKSLLVSKIAKVDKQYDLIQVDWHDHHYKAGSNFTGTVSEL